MLGSPYKSRIWIQQVSGGESRSAFYARSFETVIWALATGSVVDPAFQANPDPIRIQGFDDQKLKKKNSAEIYIYISFLTKNCHLRSPSAP
jgi:hypothetical protein